MSTAHPQSGNSFSLDELVALSDEIAALSRMGVPLERGLADVADDLTRRESALARAISAELRAGKSLPQVFGELSDRIPLAYRAVVEAGLRSGRLPSALEGVASTARRAADLRRLTRASLVYPIILAIGAYLLFLVSVIYIQPGIGEVYGTLHQPDPGMNETLSSWGRHVKVWGPLVPLVTLAAIVVWWYRSSHAAFRETGVMQFLPTQRMMAYGRIATFADIMSLLIGHDVPLDDSIVLAAEASGDVRMRSAAVAMAAEISRGAQLTAPDGQRGLFPPFLVWLLSGRADRPQLVESLRNMANSYRRRAERLEERLQLFLPAVLTIGIGGTAVVLYALSLFLPWYAALMEMPKFP